MKRVFIILSLLCLIVLHTYAQNTKGVAAEANSAGKGSRLDIGIVGSGALYKFFLFDSGEPVKSKFTFGYDAGLMTSISMRERFKLNIQLLYSQQNKTLQNKPGHPNYLVKDKMNFIEMPIFYALEFKNVSKGTTMLSGQKVYNWFIGAGPTVQYWLNYKGVAQTASLLVDSGIPSLPYTGSFSATNNYGKEELTSANRFQFGINFTAGLTFEPVERHKIMTSLQLNLMQTLMAKSDGIYPAQVITVDNDFWRGKNHNIRLSVAYLINTKIENRSKGRSTSKLSNKSKRRR